MIRLKAEALTAAVKLLDTVPKRSGVECSSIIRVKAGETLVMSLASEMAGQAYADIEETDGNAHLAFVERDGFMAFIKSAGKKDEVSIDFSDKIVEVKIGKRKAKFTNMGEVAGYQSLTGTKVTKQEISKPLFQYLSFATSYAEDSPIAPDISMIAVEAGVGLLTCFRKTALLLIEDTTLTSSFTINPTLVPLLNGDGILSLASNAATLTYPNGVLSKAVAATIADFPKDVIINKMKSVIATKPYMTCSASKLQAVLTRLSVYMKTASQIEPLILVEPIPTKKGETIPSSLVRVVLDTGSAKYTETLKVSAMPAANFELNLPRLLPIINALEADDTVSFNVDESSVLIHSENSPYKLLVGRATT